MENKYWIEVLIETSDEIPNHDIIAINRFIKEKLEEMLPNIGVTPQEVTCTSLPTD